jgi:methylmalonyl-CoA epimerase
MKKASMIKGIGHVGILVKNLEEAVNLYCELLDLERPPEFKEWPSEGMRHAMLKVGDQAFELMEPKPGSALQKFIEQRGEGIHHINLVVSDMESLVKSLKAKGATVIEREAKVSFVHPKSTKGVLLELRQPD